MSRNKKTIPARVGLVLALCFGMLPFMGHHTLHAGSFDNYDPCKDAVILPIDGKLVLDTSCLFDPLMDSPDLFITVDSTCLERISICDYSLTKYDCDADPAPPYIKTYEIQWCAFYLGGQRLTFTQTINIRIPDFSTLECPGNVIVYCLDDTGPEVTGFPTVDGHAIGEHCKVLFTYEDWETNVVGSCMTKIIREWTLINCCNLEDTTCLQEIIVADTVAPVISGCPDGDTIRVMINESMGECEAIFPLGRYPATDECTPDGDIKRFYLIDGKYFSGNIVELDTGRHRLDYIAEDACENRDTCTFYVDVWDDAPLIACASLANYTLPADKDSVCLSIDLLPVDVTETCSELVEVLVGRDTTQLDSCLAITCADLGDTIKYWVKATNNHGLSSFGWCSLHVKGEGTVELVCDGLDTVNVPCDQVPPDLEDLHVLFGSPEVIVMGQACPPALDSITEVEMCNNFGTITRTWYLLGSNGNRRDSCKQTIAITIAIEGRPNMYGGNTNIMRCECFDTVEVQPITLSPCSVSPDVVITNNSPYAFASGADASGDYPVGVHYVDYTITGDCFAPFIITDTITVIDNVTKTTNGSDCIPPDEWRDVYNRDIEGQAVMSLFIINEDCEVDTVKIENIDVTLQNGNQDTVYTITWTYTDTSGNTSPNSTHILTISAVTCTGRSLLANGERTGTHRAGEDPENEARAKVLVSLNQPNPFSHSTVIPFNNEVAGQVTLEVMDLEGSAVDLQSRTYPAGSQQFRFKPNSALSKGILIYRLKTPTSIYTGKMLWQY